MNVSYYIQKFFSSVLKGRTLDQKRILHTVELTIFPLEQHIGPCPEKGDDAQSNVAAGHHSSDAWSGGVRLRLCKQSSFVYLWPLRWRSRLDTGVSRFALRLGCGLGWCAVCEDLGILAFARPPTYLKGCVYR